MVPQYVPQPVPAADEAGVPDAAALAASYSFVDEPQVFDFIAGVPPLVPLLMEAVAAIRRCFAAATLSIEVVDDPDVEQDRQLAVLIATEFAPEEASERLARFDDEWWRERLPLAHHRLFITLAFA